MKQILLILLLLSLFVFSIKSSNSPLQKKITWQCPVNLSENTWLPKVALKRNEAIILLTFLGQKAESWMSFKFPSYESDEYIQKYVDNILEQAKENRKEAQKLKTVLCSRGMEINFARKEINNSFWMFVSRKRIPLLKKLIKESKKNQKKESS
jgi:hypothetical protein